MRFTLFPDRFATTKADHDETWEAICAGIANAPEYADKASCPWISLAVYGDAATDKGCLRNAANVRFITGIEGDYDGEEVSIDEAARRARAFNVSACFYTSPSHRPDAPRWRVIVPLGREYPLEARDAYMNRLNGVLGGILSGESWSKSQAFIVGRVRGVEYRCVIV